jgi:hypothetical protein
MAKKRSASKQEEEEVKEEQDQMMDDSEEEGFENGDYDDQDDDDDDEMDDGEDNGEDDAAAVPDNGDVKVGSPSPMAIKDMQLRSGRRKRRRSKETTGLTPPHGYEQSQQRKKRVRTETAKKATNSSNDNGKEVLDESSEPPAMPTAASLGTNGAAVADSGSGCDASSPHQTANPRRISFMSPNLAVGRSRMDEEEQMADEDNQGDEMVPPKPGSSIQVGNRKANGVARGSSAEPAPDNGSAATKTLPQAVELTGIPTVGESKGQEEDADLLTSKILATTQRQKLLTLLFMVALALLVFVVGPLMVKIADVIVPLDSGLLPPHPPEIPMIPNHEEWLDGNTEDEEPEVEFIHEDPDVIEEIVTEVVEPPSEESMAWNNGFMDTLHELEQLKHDLLSSTDSFNDRYIDWVEQIQGLRTQLSSRQERVQDRLWMLSELEDVLNRRIDVEHEDDDELWSADLWDRLRTVVQETGGKALLDSDSIELWEMPEIEEDSCTADIFDGDNEEEETAGMEELEEGMSPLFRNLLEDKESELLLRAQMTAERFVNGDVAEQRIRGWIKAELDRALDGHGDLVHALSRLDERASGMTVEEADHPNGSNALSVKAVEYLQEAIQQQLQIDRADVTGVYDHASLMNGATVLYGGKRGTSKSLIDDLPVVNRILQRSRFRFCGFGPEVALTPTYPRNSLGQCWSFHQTTLEEQLKERALFQSDTGTPDDFKRGSFGTLTISLPHPVRVGSVIIEHPPMRLTDQSGSSIRSFRVVGYEDDKASSKAWNLGSFQYDIQRNRRNEYLQEFEVSTAVFGKEVPAFQSISLAVDSNWGHDYACLYRFRVHGDIAES